MRIPKDEDGGDLVEVKAWKADGEPFLTLHRNPVENPYCMHMNHTVLLDDNRRTVRCSSCETILDPIEVLLWLARKEASLLYTREKRLALESQIRELKAEEKRVKERLKRARGKDL